MSVITRSILEFIGREDSALRSIRTLKREAGGLGESFGQLGGRMKTVGGNIRGVGRTLLPLSAGFAAVGGGAIKMATDFNAGMANVATLIPGNIERVEELKTTVQDMAVSVGKSTADLSGGLFQVISAFGDSAETAGILDVNARAAAAGLATTTDAINLTSAVTKGYNDTSLEAIQHVSDLAFMTNKLGQTTFPELAASMGRVVPLASELTVSQEELFGVMATATGVTGTASEVSTQLRGVLQSLLAPTKEMDFVFGQLGVTSGEALIQQEGLQGAIEAVVAEAEGSGMALQRFIGSIEGQTLALALTGAQADTFTDKLEAMNDVAGATDEAFREQSEGINEAGFLWKQLQQRVATAAQRFGDKLLPVLLDTFDALAPVGNKLLELLDWFGDLPAPVQRVAAIIGGLVAILGPVALAFGTVISAVGSLIATMGPVIALVAKVGAAIAALGAGPLLAIVAAVAAVVTAWLNWDEIVEITARVVTGVREWIVDKFGRIVEAVREKVEAVTGFFSDMFDNVVGRSFVPDMVDQIGGHIDRLDSVFVDRIKGQLEKIGGEGGFFAQLSGDVSRLVGDLFAGRDVSGSLANLATEGLAFLANAIVPGLGEIVGLFARWGDDIWRGVKKAFSRIWDGIRNLARGFRSLIGSLPGFGGIRGRHPDTDLTSPFPGIPGQGPGDEGGTAITGPGNIFEAQQGGIGRVTQPTAFLAGVHAPEEFAFSGEGRGFGRFDDAGILSELGAIRRELFTERRLTPDLVRAQIQLHAGR